ncbi:MAG: S49 family peptidase [Rhizobium sp.]|nr:S49 family peptidase [Rhizobium sp.]
MNPEIMNLVSSFLGNAGGGHSRRGLAPWAIRAEEVISSLQMVRNVRGAAPHAGAASMAATLSSETLAPGSFARRVGNTAIVPVYGPLVARFSYGYFSYEEIIRDLRLAAGTAGITRILMEIDSPGGIGFMIDSVPAVIAEITQTIPVDGHIRGIGASAAYWIASAGGRVTADRTSLVGSVGALIHYVDLEGILTKLGGTVIEAIAQQSPNKRLPHESDAGKAELQAIVDDAGQMFVEALARHRGVAVETILETYGQGLVFAAPAALSRGMIDAIMPFEQVLAGMADPLDVDQPDPDPAAVSTHAQPKQESVMTALNSSTAAAVILTMAALKADYPGLVADLHAEGAENEFKRLTAIDELAAGLVGVDKLVGELKADRKITPEAAAGKLLAASKANLSERMKGLELLDKAADGVTSTLSGGDGGGGFGCTADARGLDGRMEFQAEASGRISDHRRLCRDDEAQGAGRLRPSPFDTRRRGSPQTLSTSLKGNSHDHARGQ